MNGKRLIYLLSLLCRLRQVRVRIWCAINHKILAILYAFLILCANRLHMLYFVDPPPPSRPLARRP